MLNRRKAIAAALGAPAAVALPVVAEAAVTPEAVPAPIVTQEEAVRILLGNVRLSHYVVQQRLVDMIARMNLKLMRKNPDLFDSRYVMTAPVAEIEGHTVEAKTRKYSVRYTFTADGDSIAPHETVTEMREAIEDGLVEGMTQEIRSELAKSPPGTQYCSYVPILSAGVVIDPVTFNPVVSFITRFGTFQRA